MAKLIFARRIFSALGNVNKFPLLSLNEKIAISKTAYNIQLKGYVGGWEFDLSFFNDYDEFMTFCKTIHADGEEPELLKDYEGCSCFIESTDNFIEFFLSQICENPKTFFTFVAY